MFKRTIPWLALFWMCTCLAQVKVQTQLPKIEFAIEIRQIEDALDATEGYRAGTADTAREWPPVSLVVRNGEKGILRLQQTVPMQWLQSAQSHSNTLTVPGASASSSGGGVSQALHWFDVGQSITVTPKWPGGKKDVSLELDVEQADMQTVHNADLPRQVRIQTTTVVSLPFNQWMTIAASGTGPGPTGSYSSEARAQVRRLLQVRVLADN